MKNIARLLALLLVLTLVFSLVACQGGTSRNKKDKDDDDDKEEVVDTTAEPEAPSDDVPATPEATEEPTEEPSQEIQGSEVVSDNSIVGHYALPMTLESLVAFASEGEELDEDAQMALQLFSGADPFNLLLDINEETFSLSVDEDGLKQTLGDAFLANLPSMLPLLMEMTDEELDAQLASSGMTREQLANIIAGQLNVDELLDGAFGDFDTFSGVYRLDGDKLYVGEYIVAQDGYLVVEADSAKLIIKEVVGLEDEDEEYQKLKALLPWTFTKIG